MNKNGGIIMDGIKKFTNNTCVDLAITLTVRSGERPGCVARIEEFNLRCSESKVIDYGGKFNPFLDGIRAYSCDPDQFTETGVLVKKCGSAIDKLLNTNNHITFLIAAQSLVISGSSCKI